MSIIQPYQPPLLEVEKDTLPELQPVFTYLNGHSKKVYTEGYFLKLNDLNPGTPLLLHDSKLRWTPGFSEADRGKILDRW